MKTSLSLWDAIFGKKVTIEVPMTIGGIKEIKVTKKWMDQKVREGKIKPLSTQPIKVNILDAMGGLSIDQFSDPAEFLNALAQPTEIYRVEYWTIGEQISQEQYDKYRDPKTNEIYVMIQRENGTPESIVCQRNLWINAYEAMKKN